MTKELKATSRKITDYRPDPANPNAHSERGVGVLSDSIASVGLGRSIVVDRNGIVLAGNSTQERAVDQGFEDAIEVESDGTKLVVVKRNDLDLMSDDPQNKARLLSYYDNYSALTGVVFDPEQVQRDIDAGVDLEKLFGTFDLDAILANLNKGTPADDPGAQMDRAEALQAKWNVQRGQLWAIGDHRLLCGDSTNAEDVTRVMGGECAKLVHTDPPYGVDVVGGTRDPRDTKNFRSGNDIQNDDLSDDELKNIVDGALKLTRSIMADGAAYYVWHPSSRVELFVRSVRECLAPHRQIIVWVKDNFVFGRQDYHWQHEPCFYGWVGDAAHHAVEDRTQGTVWHVEAVGTDLEKKIHPTAKPVGLPLRAINNSSFRGDVIYDPFLGSGTTLVACEQTGRKGRGIEIEPKYCAVILERMSGMGITPRLSE